jgi:spore coat protein CotF
MRLDDKDILTDCLVDAKFCSTGYHLAALESSSDQIRNSFIRLMNDELATAKMIFDAMYQRGWYQVEMARDVARQAAPGMQAQYTAPGAGVRPEYNPPGMRPEAFGRPEEPHRW